MLHLQHGAVRFVNDLQGKRAIRFKLAFTLSLRLAAQSQGELTANQSYANIYVEWS